MNYTSNSSSDNILQGLIDWLKAFNISLVNNVIADLDNFVKKDNNERKKRIKYLIQMYNIAKNQL